MAIGVINRGCSLSQVVDLGFNHGVFILLFILFRPFPFIHAQPGNFPSPVLPSPPSYVPGFPRKFNPSLAIIMVILVSSFSIVGIFSIYIRHCSGRRSSGLFLISPAASVMGGGQRSQMAPLGLEKQVIETFPTFIYSAVKGLKIGEGSLECAVCLNEFEDDDTLRLIPKCNHVFHPDCIGEWLAAHTTCPVCRANLVPKPGDVPLGSVLVVEPDNVSVQENQQSITTDQTRDEVAICVADDNPYPEREREAHVTLQNPVHKNRPPRSWSTGWQFARLFPRSHSTGHSLVQPGENCERFTLRFPAEIRGQLLNTHLRRAQSCVAFPRASSSRRGYRSRSVGIGRTRNSFPYERFDHEGQPHNFGCTITLPFMARTGSVQSSKGTGSTGSDEVNATTLQKFSRSIRSPIDRLFSGTGDGNNQNDHPGERSSDGLTKA